MAQLSLAGNTRDIVDWEKLRSLAIVALSKRERCKLLLDLANGVVLPPDQWNRLVGSTVLSGPEGFATGLNAARRKALTATLSRFLASTKQERSTMFKRVKIFSDAHTFLAPFDSERAKADRPLIAETVNAGIGYALQILFDPADEFAAKLSWCRYSECKAFFFARPARGGVGRPATRYCCPAHVKAGVLEQARLRMRNHRK